MEEEKSSINVEPSENTSTASMTHESWFNPSIGFCRNAPFQWSKVSFSTTPIIHHWALRVLARAAEIDAIALLYSQ
jgi:hypothetical protein